MKDIVKVVVVGTRRPDYPRDCEWAKFFEEANFNLVDLSTPIRFVSKSSQERCCAWIKNAIYRHSSWVIKLKSIIGSLRSPETDFIFIYKNNHLLSLICSLLKRRKSPKTIIVYDSWISLSLKSQTTDQPSFISSLLRSFERRALSSADRLVTLSKEYSSYYEKQYNLHTHKYVVPLGAGTVWEETPKLNEVSGVHFTYWGNFLEQHGVDVILEAAKLLAAEDIRIHLVGKGKLRDQLERRAAEGNIPNLQFRGSLSDAELIQLIDSSIACFGHLKPIHDFDLVLPNKAVQALARSKPVIMINDGSADSRYLQSKVNSPIIAIDGSPQSLAETLMTLASKPYDSSESDQVIQAYYKAHYCSAVVHSQMQLVFEK